MDVRIQMSLEFGNIEHVEVVNDEIRITGHAWVGLAFDHDNAYTVTRLVGVDPREITSEKIETLKEAGDVYDCEITRKEGASVVRIVIYDQAVVAFHCANIVKEFRYYNAAELHEIFQWLPGRSTPEELRGYIDSIRKHGFLVTINGSNVRIAKIE